MGGFSGNVVSAILGGFVLALIAGTYVWSHVFTRFRKKTSMMLVALGGTLVVCVDLLAINHLDGASRLWLALLLPLLVLAVGTESGFTPAVLAYLADVTEDFATERGVIMGLYSLFLGVGEVIGGVLGGRFAEVWGLDGLIFATVILVLIAFASILGTRPIERPIDQ
jgi:predicted MFS family arabinose efflux permease